ELLPREGTGESAFWSYPVEVFDHSRTESTSLGDFISENGVENLGYRRITYLRNETYPSTIRDWNITLGSDPDFASGDGYFFQVATSAEIGVVPRNFMEISGEGRIEDLSVFGKTPRVITLERFETALRSSDHSERMFVGNEHAPTFGMEIIRRVPDDQSALASLFNSAVGIETAEECDLFIGHVQDRSDPMKLYVVVVDGRTGEIISTAEAEGLCIFLVNRYGLDLA
ncbi:MAG: hypothetical protein U9R75_04490, partial [Candidatus Thermoplasmatota archaeon]|nr:hypothetical protein [Candidatus Thermoplasmatota archaeon]